MNVMLAFDLETLNVIFRKMQNVTVVIYSFFDA